MVNALRIVTLKNKQVKMGGVLVCCCLIHTEDTHIDRNALENRFNVLLKIQTSYPQHYCGNAPSIIQG
ncbi:MULTISPECIES: hypothetical protein [Cyanophyceae]|uniref:hypothetical protein n=1 Tax=Cyanophyceae TaxID=3028117 RepID=UPI00168524B7|nr:hypothetical protein [Trichocoleus sp. FACHB-40]MBD2001713.1 hypothetical protein [Trichocoleus sp. FACHB-40]